MKQLGTLIFISSILSGCAGQETIPDGRTLYLEQHEGGNAFACANCHALTEPSEDGFRRPAHPLADVTKRPNYKNGQLDSLLDAVNTCRTEWMAADAFDADSPRWLELLSFLEAQAPEGPAPALNFDIVAPPSTLTGGDAMVGQELFNSSCAVCHGQDAAGTGRAPNLVGDLLTADLIATRVRTSGREMSSVYSGLTGGRMPFWAADRLSDSELIDITAFVLSNNGDGGGGGGGATLRECDSTHPKIGQVAELSTIAHGVSGRAEIIDDCTIEITNFNFDGQGIDVRFYSGLAGNFTTGFSMSEDIRKSSGYANETVYAQLPTNRSLDDLDALSVWCVPVGTSFGDGEFEE